tara:strand:- start:809 stop:1177 length:369 start_codon:yes stop_codon:yes gene_type:complete
MRILFVCLALLHVWPSSGHTNEIRPYLRWQTYNYTFGGKNVNRCVNKAFKYLVVNGFEKDADSSVNEEGTYGYAYGWTSDLGAQASIACDLEDDESVVMLTYFGKAYEAKDSLWEMLKSGKW